MIYQENIQKIGYFWLPSEPNNKLAGLLNIKDGRYISLELHGLFGKNPYEQYNNPLDIEIILGDIEEYGKITLVDNHYNENRICWGLEVKYKNVVTSDFIFIGTHFIKKNDIKISSFVFRVKGLNEWMGISGISAESSYDNCSIFYSKPDNLLISIDDIFNLKVIYSYSSKIPVGVNNHAEIYQDTYFSIEAKKNLPFLDFFTLAKKIANFLIFAIDKQVSIEKITVQQIGLNISCINGVETNIQKDIRVFTNKILHVRKIDKIYIDSILFRYRDIMDFKNIIQRWLKMYNQIDPSLDLYFSVRFSKDDYIKSKFLMLAQALESLHRRLNLNNLTLLERLKELSQDFINMSVYSENEMVEFTKKIKDTRNYLTHYDKSSESKAITDDEYHIYINTMEWLLSIHFLKLLGFKQDKIYKFMKFDKLIRGSK